MKKKIGIITGARAEYDLLKPLIKLFHEDDQFEMTLMVTGMHLSKEFGMTVEMIEKDEFPIADKIEMLLNSDTSAGIAKSIGLGVIAFADALRRLKPELLLVLGDRFEILSAVLPAFTMQLPIIHLHGGETTEGAFDEGFRHAITKMSHLHFTSTEAYRLRVIQLGEQPQHVFNVGAIGVENIKSLEKITKAELENKLKFKFLEKNMLITFHPATLEKTNTRQGFNNLLTVLHEEYNHCGLIFTKANADPEGKIINEMIDEFVVRHPKSAIAYTAMGRFLYLNTMRFVDAVVGNSSSGIIEAPSCAVGTINLGNRQKGRVRAASIIDCAEDMLSIKNAFAQLFLAPFQSSLKNIVNPYDGGRTSEKIFSIIKKLSPTQICLQKSFYDIKQAIN